ncbi:MAG: di-heme oxidoredictase family protein [Kofleriaceae bacterium]
MRLGTIALAIVATGVGACGDNDEGDDRQGGDTTVDDRTREAFTHSAPNLTEEERMTFHLGRGPFNFVWAPPQLGRLFNNPACLGCHGGNGRGLSLVMRGQEFGSQALVRVSLADGEPATPGGNIPVPGFGEQLQDHATAGLPEVFIEVEWVESTTFYGDGTPQPMREPRVMIQLPNINDPLPPWMISYRQAPPLHGLGLLEAIPDTTLAELEDPDDADGDGISGRRNLVWDSIAQTMTTGRFGHKASVATLVDQAAGAFVNDMGLTNKVFPEEDGITRDVNDDQLAQVTLMISTIAVPAAAPRNSDALRGKTLFTQFQCASCHIPALETGDHPIAAVANQRIHPYTDLLLHDVGDLLTDARPDQLATGTEWRTPPLWGIGLTQLVQPGTTFLHDGRARTLEEAILWHGGEAEASQQAFRNAKKTDRDSLIRFLQTL